MTTSARGVSPAVAHTGNRAERLRKTSVKEKQTETCLPFIDTFFDRLEGDESMFLSSSDLHKEYISHVVKYTDDAKALALVKSVNRFAKTMKKESGRRQWTYTAGPQRGYRIGIKHQRLERRLQHKHTCKRVTSPPRVLYIDRTRGHGCFATDNYNQGDIVCDYLGQIIDRNEKMRRENDYEQRHISYRIINLPNGKFLDGAMDENGQELPITNNPGAAMNNCSSSPNCRLRLVNGACVMVATNSIYTGAELTWWYGDSRKIPGCSWLQE